MRGAWDNMMKAKEQSNIAKNASADANRYCHEAKIIMEDTAKYRVESAESAEMAKKGSACRRAVRPLVHSRHNTCNIRSNNLLPQQP